MDSKWVTFSPGTGQRSWVELGSICLVDGARKRSPLSGDLVFTGAWARVMSLSTACATSSPSPRHRITDLLLFKKTSLLSRASVVAAAFPCAMGMTYENATAL